MTNLWSLGAFECCLSVEGLIIYMQTLISIIFTTQCLTSLHSYLNSLLLDAKRVFNQFPHKLSGR